MSDRPRARFNIESDPGFCVFDLSAEYKIDPEEFISKGKATPFAGEMVFGKCLLTVCNGQIVYSDLT